MKTLMLEVKANVATWRMGEESSHRAFWIQVFREARAFR